MRSGEPPTNGATVKHLVQLAACVLGFALTVGAQPSPGTARSAADVAVERGRLADAETMLFDASRVSPRDPVVRGALGTFLASRGRVRVGAVLLEEARRFGGDADAINALLAHLYQWTGDWSAAAMLPGTPSGARRARAKYLAAHPHALSGADSARVPLTPPEGAGVGRISLEIGGVSFMADIDPGIEGLLLPEASAVTTGVRAFGAEDGTTFAVADSMGIGTFMFRNVPAQTGPVTRPRVGLDLLAPLNPTFDMGAKSLTLRRNAPEPAGGELMPLLLRFPGIEIVTTPGSAPVGLTAAAGTLLQGERWTFDLRHGAVRAQR